MELTQMRNILTALGLAIGLAGSLAGTAQAQDMSIANGKIATCIACHTYTGISQQPIYPNIAGQHKAYLISSVKAYRDGHRKNPLMSPMAAGLTDEEIDALATHYAAQDPSGKKK